MLDQVFHDLAPYLDKYGYWAIFAAVFLEGIGIPTPGQTLIMLGAFYSTSGKLDIVPLVLIAWGAAYAGTIVGYGLGRFGGRKFVLRFGRYFFLTRDRLEMVERFFRRRGRIVALFARFVDVSRQLNGIASGIARMPWRRFVFYNAFGSALWVCFWALMSYRMGEKVTRFGDILRTREFYIVVGAALFIAAFGFLLVRSHRKKSRA
ncbi:MAG TPA: DedA family protein [Thermodesulfobacteriota bacterium]|nr:DedA family protein [Thermodesulfobacteriota bacterium]